MLSGTKETMLLVRHRRDNIISTFHLAPHFLSFHHQHLFHQRDAGLVRVIGICCLCDCPADFLSPCYEKSLMSATPAADILN